MPPTVVQPTDRAYVTLAEAKEWLKIDDATTKWDNIVQRLINSACDAVESYIEGPVLTRSFFETRDGNSSNVLVPEYSPVTEIVEIKIDYNRGFADSTTVQPENYILRGAPQFSQVGPNPYIMIKGTDIVLRDDENIAILGRIFSGSTAGAIRVEYKAGYGTADELPQDLVLATLQLIEHFYLLRENRQMNVKSKSNTGQGYSIELGWPMEVTKALDEYKDYSFGLATTPQKNTFTI